MHESRSADSEPRKEEALFTPCVPNSMLWHGPGPSWVVFGFWSHLLFSVLCFRRRELKECNGNLYRVDQRWWLHTWEQCCLIRKEGEYKFLLPSEISADVPYVSFFKDNDRYLIVQPLNFKSGVVYYFVSNNLCFSIRQFKKFGERIHCIIMVTNTNKEFVHKFTNGEKKASDFSPRMNSPCNEFIIHKN